MSIIDAALNRSRSVMALLVMLLGAGVVAFITIPKESDPDINIPIIYVSIGHDGISPEDAERLLVRPMENELRGIEGVKEMRSTAYQGGANVLLEFDAGFDADTALDDVREKVDIAKPELPDDSDEPTVNEVNLSLFPVLIVTLSGDVPERTLMRIARKTRDRLEGIPSVLSVDIGGDRDEVVEIIIDPALVDSYELDASVLLSQLSRSNLLIAAGALDTGLGRFSIKVPGLFETVQDILQMPIKVSTDAVVTLGDIASIRRTFKDQETYARVNGQRAVTLEIVKRTGENIIETIEAARELVEIERQDWPPGLEVRFTQDKSKDIRIMLGDLRNNVISAVLLVMIVIIAALGVRSGLLVGIAIPGSFLTGMLVLQSLGLTVNVVVLFALILAVGMLVDGAIVVTEYADRKLREGEPPSVAFGLAAKRMSWPIIASTATTLAAFAPLLFWPGIVGEFMKFLPITLIATLSASLLMALIFVPVLGASLGAITQGLLFIMGVVGGAGLFGFLTFQGLGQLIQMPAGLPLNAGTALGAIIGAVLAFRPSRRAGEAAKNIINRPPSGGDNIRQQALSPNSDVDVRQAGGFTGIYVRVLSRALRFPSLILVAALLLLAGSWTAYIAFGKGVEFFPDIEPDVAVINVHARGNLSVDEKAALVIEVESVVLLIQEERGEFDSIYTNTGNLRSQDDEAEDIVGKIQLEFGEWDQRRSADDILAEITERTAHLAGIHVESRKQEGGPPVGKPVQVRLSSRIPSLLPDETTKVRAFFDSLDGLKDIEDSRPMPGIEWELSVDRPEAAKFGADISLIGNAIKLATNGLRVTDYRPDDSDEEIDVTARFPVENRTTDQLDRIRVTTSEGLVPLSNFVQRRPIPKTGTLQRVDSERVMSVKADIHPGILAEDMVQQIKDWLASADIDPRVTVTFQGEDEEQAAAQAFLKKAFTIALFIMAIILVTQFNSFYSALLILSAVILSTVGVMLGLLLIRQPFGIVMSGVGVIALAGIVVNNNIVLIDTYDRLKQTMGDAREAILLTGAQRLRPVFLTSFTTILGLMPMVLQINIDFFTREISQGAPSTQWWVQLSTAIVCGLAFATVLTLIVTPCALMVRANVQAHSAAKRLKAPGAVPAAAE